MTQTRPGSTGALWARFRFSVVGPLLSSPPARGALQAAIRSLAEKTWSHPVTGRDLSVAAGTIALVLHGACASATTRSALCARRAQRLRQDLAGASPCRATASSVPRSPGLELSIALRQPYRLGGGRSDAWEATLLFHGQALHAGPRPGEEARAFFAPTPWRSPRRTKAANARGPQL